MKEEGEYSGDGSKALHPFLKWAGGKRWFVNSYGHLLPTAFDRYVEPFLGSGAVFFHLRPKRALLSDANLELIDTYRALKGDWKSVLGALKRHDSRHCDEYYYETRDFFRPRLLHTRAARFLYLNRTCWNGLYRVNRYGEFNVPRGTKDAVLQPTDDFESWSSALKFAELEWADFETSINSAKAGDFVFCDPPYTVAHNKNGFLKYNHRIFSWQDQVRLRDALIRLDSRGGQFVVTNAMHKSVRSLYQMFDQYELERSSVISGEAKGRRQTSELLVRNF